MKISDRINRTSDVQTARTGDSRQAKTPGSAKDSDQIGLSALGAQLSRSSSFEDSAKISQLLEAVSTGRYRPDPSAVSASVIQHSLVAASAF
jgi:anti-sigma28 factor (negative regulator of flagellin synthesis)